METVQPGAYSYIIVESGLRMCADTEVNLELVYGIEGALITRC